MKKYFSVIVRPICVCYCLCGIWFTKNLWFQSNSDSRISINFDSHESIIEDGNVIKVPNLRPKVEKSFLIPTTVEWYNVLTDWVSLCSQVARLTLERFTGKSSGIGRSNPIPKWDAITLIKQGIKGKYIKEVWVLTWCIVDTGTLEGDFLLTEAKQWLLTWSKTGVVCGFEAVNALQKTFEKLMTRSKDTIWDVYFFDPKSYGYGKGHRFVMFRWSDNQIYVLDPILWMQHAFPKSFSDYFTSIMNTKYGSVLYVGRGYKVKGWKG